jgi:hypothetical protein
MFLDHLSRLSFSKRIDDGDEKLLRFEWGRRLLYTGRAPQVDFVPKPEFDITMAADTTHIHCQTSLNRSISLIEISFSAAG